MGKKINGAEVVGVVKDFSVSSIHTKIEPLGLFSYSPGCTPDNLTFGLRGNNIPALWILLRKSWK